MNRRPDTGQAAVELALVLPLLVVLLLGLVQVGLVVRDQVLLVHAAREAARQLAVADTSDNDDNATARRAALAAVGSGLRAELLTLAVTERAGRVAVRAGYRAPIEVPLVDFAARYVPLTAFAEMTREKN
jgi:Flp pilus assembly protein TadG